MEKRENRSLVEEASPKAAWARIGIEVAAIKVNFWFCCPQLTQVFWLRWLSFGGDNLRG